MAADHAEAQDGAAAGVSRRSVPQGRHDLARLSGVQDPGAPGLVLSPTASVGRNVRFGANVVVHDGVVIGDGVTVQDGAILGKSPTLGPRSTAPRDPGQPLVIEEDAAICAQAIVFAGAHIGVGAIIGDQTFIRERSRIGAGTVIGRGSCVDNDVRIGERVRVQTNVYLTGYSVIEDDVFVGPYAMTTNDDTMARHAPGTLLRGATLRRACRVGGAAVLTPGVEIGEEAFVAAGAVVTNDVPPRSLVLGIPARVVRQVEDEELLERWT
jgi:acetyltransferase-like isoleucine patch superfamily enzyme